MAAEKEPLLGRETETDSDEPHFEVRRRKTSKKMAYQASFWSQLRTMMWRNFLLKRRNKSQLVQELFFPIYFVGIMAMIKALTQPATQPAISGFPANSLNNSQFQLNSQLKILVTPNTATYQDVMSRVSSSLGNIAVEYFSSQEAALQHYTDNADTVAAGVYFNYQSGNNFSYALRFPYASFKNQKKVFAEAGLCRQADGLQRYSCDANSYLFSGFLSLQTAVDVALTQVFGDPSLSSPDVAVQLMPMGEYTPNLLQLQITSSIYFVFGYSFFINFLTVNIVAEKEKKIREGMKMMGLRDAVFWLSWSLTYFIIILAVTLILILITFVAQFFNNSNLFILFLMLFLYGLSIINIAFLLTPFFKHARAAGAFAGFSSIFISCLYLLVQFTNVPAAAQWVMCLLSPVALAIAINWGVQLDILHGGMTFDTMTLGDFPLYAPIIMLVVDTVLYLLLAIYLDHVIPGEYGVRYKPLYFLQSSYWKPVPKKHSSVQLQRALSSPESLEDVEPISSDMVDKAAIRIHKISKSFKNKEKKDVFAVNGLSFNIYEGQITALLGHNGAGKTTLINMLCGLLPPSSGTATILGQDITETGNMERIRSSFGICPQHNILYEDLSAEEHLRVFAGIKGVPEAEISHQVEKALRDTDIADQAKVFAKNLSGGQKRKLSVAMALIGDPKIIFLDEPTAGMDPFSRRHLWSLLKNGKEGRVILLTTHFMDEADILADRKAIISKGRLRCCGSSLFLKNRFGIGYHLNMVAEEHCQAEKVTALLKEHVQGIELKRTHGSEVAYTLPASEIANFSAMFSALEEKPFSGITKAEELGVQSYGVSMTTLEEVFLKLGEEADMEEEMNGDLEGGFFKKISDETSDQGDRARPAIVGSSISVDMNVGLSTFNLVPEEKQKSQTFWALIKILVLTLWRNPGAPIFQVVLPVVFVLAGLLINKYSSQDNSASNPQALVISPQSYARMQAAPVASVPALATFDLSGTSLSSSLLSTLASSLVLDQYSSNVNLSQVAPHWLGVSINDITSSTINFTALYNDTALHGLPAIVNFMSTARLAVSNITGYFNATSLPWPAVSAVPSYNNDVFSSTILLGLAFVIIPTGFAIVLVQNRQNKIRSQLRVSGVTFGLYWGSFYLFNLLIFAIPSVLCIIIILAAQIPSLSSAGAVVALLLLLIFYIPSVLLLAYIFSFAFDKYESAQAAMPNIFFFISFLPYIVVSLLDMILTDKTVAAIIHYVFIVIDPPYTIFGGCYYIDRVYRYLAWTSDGSQAPFGDYFKPSNHILVCILMPIVHIIWMYLLLRILDVRSTGGSIREALWLGKGAQVNGIPISNDDIAEDGDEDVRHERERVERLRENRNQVTVATVRNLRKEFRKRGKETLKGCTKVKEEDKIKVAVRNTTFGVDRGEVFGLLGPNGAGKTTTMNMMIAEESPTKGEVMVAGYNVQSNLSQAFQTIGYCPQHDAIWEKITLMEHLQCFAAIKGIAKEDIDAACEQFISGLRVAEHAKKYAKKLSGGTKRKLSYALSMLGNPQLVLMDEPSTGMDPQSKRFLWDTISSSFRNTERGAILTTHYMEEADALCTRIAIMVNGNIECLGSSQHLKDKYGSGYLLEVKLGAASAAELERGMTALDEHLLSLFPGAVCSERFAERAMYKIPRHDVTSLAQTFAALEDAKHSFNVEEYSFSQSSLEQVFLEFAKKQLEEGQDAKEMSGDSVSQRPTGSIRA